MELIIHDAYWLNLLPATMIWYETLYDGMQINQLKLFIFVDSRDNGFWNNLFYTDNTFIWYTF